MMFYRLRNTTTTVNINVQTSQTHAVMMLSALTSSRLKTGLLAYSIVVGGLMVYNLRWQYLGDVLFRRKPKKLPIHKLHAKTKKKTIVVLLHGMWHDKSWFSKLQKLLCDRGYSSYAVDLLPGERFLLGFSQTEIVADLEHTLSTCEEEEEDVKFILLGHSQGGLVVQSCLKNSPQIASRTKAAVLLATFPLGLTPPVMALMREPRNMYNKIEYAGICLFGKLISLEYLKHIFLLPTTDLKDKNHHLQEYTANLLKAPADGLITMSHFPQAVGVISTKPTLVLGAKEDIIYPPHLLESDFQKRFPNAIQKSIPRQAHCFMDGGYEMEKTLIDWLDQIQ